jgi:hypothetical protein
MRKRIRARCTTGCNQGCTSRKPATFEQRAPRFIVALIGGPWRGAQVMGERGIRIKLVFHGRSFSQSD